jgi:hypothetical protein
MCPTVARTESLVDSGMTAHFVVSVVSPLATWTEGPEVVAGVDAGAMRFGCRVEVVTGGAGVDNGGVIGKVGGGRTLVFGLTNWICLVKFNTVPNCHNNQ